MAKNTVNSDIFRLSVNLGRATWIADLAFGLVIVLLLWHEERLPQAAAWWCGLACVVGARSLYCHAMGRRLAASPGRLPAAADAYAALAALEGAVWALLLVLLPAATPSSGVIQLALTMAVLLGSVFAFAPVGIAWAAYAVPVGSAQLVFLVARDVPLRVSLFRFLSHGIRDLFFELTDQVPVFAILQKTGSVFQADDLSYIEGHHVKQVVSAYQGVTGASKEIQSGAAGD